MRIFGVVAPGAVAIFEVDPQVFDRLVRELGLDKREYLLGEFWAEVERLGERGWVWGEFGLGGERLGAPQPHRVGGEPVRGHIDRMDGLTAMPVPWIARGQLRVGDR